MNENEFNVDHAPQISGLRFRKFRGDSDFPIMASILEAASEAEKEEPVQTVEDIKTEYKYLTNLNTQKDMLFTEIDDSPIAFSRVEWWQEENPNDRIYSFMVKILPERRNQGIELTMIQWCESRLRQIAENHPQDSNRFFQTYSYEFKTNFNNHLESLNYRPARYFIDMIRPLESIPEAELPVGIEVRTIGEDEVCKVWDASNEAFQDHWGYSEPKDEQYLAYKESRNFQPELWQVAWDGDEVVGSVRNFIDHEYNKKYNRKRGWTEFITTRREWRRQGIAKALIIYSMQMHKAMGLSDVGLRVDTLNLTGALKLYQDLGYKKEKTLIAYRKPI
jgi:ribosomal protein S18 acetylase RimI-like enzyme